MDLKGKGQETFVQLKDAMEPVYMPLNTALRDTVVKPKVNNGESL